MEGCPQHTPFIMKDTIMANAISYKFSLAASIIFHFSVQCTCFDRYSRFSTNMSLYSLDILNFPSFDTLLICFIQGLYLYMLEATLCHFKNVTGHFIWEC